MNATGWTILAIFLAMDAIIVGAIIYSMRESGWGRVARAHPAVFGPMDVQGKIAWGMGIGLLNAGACFRIWGDKTHLHFDPVLLGKLVRLSPASIPWDSMRVEKPGRWTVTVHVDRSDLRLPVWAVAEAPDSIA